MTKDQLLIKRIYWPKIAMFGFAIVLPQIAIAWSNREVFPDALWIATVFVVVVIGISGISTYFSGNAAPNTRKYALWHDFAVAALTCVVALFHFQIAREVSAGKEARIVQEQKSKTGQENMDREIQRQLAIRQADAERMKLETDAMKEQRRLLIQLPPSQRRFVPQGGNPATATTPSLPSFSSVVTVPPKETPDEIKSPEAVRASWFGWLFWASALEIVIAVLGGMILMMVWQWDVDGDGQPDAPPVANNRPFGFGDGAQMSPTPVTGKTTTISGGGNFQPPSTF